MYGRPRCRGLAVAGGGATWVYCSGPSCGRPGDPAEGCGGGVAEGTPVQLEQAVGAADQLPFRLGGLLTPPGEPADAVGVFDLSEDRLDDRLAPPLQAVVLGVGDLPVHPLHCGDVLRQRPVPSCPGRGVLLHVPRRDVAVGVLQTPTPRRCPPRHTPHRPAAAAAARRCQPRPGPRWSPRSSGAAGPRRWRSR